MWSFHPAFPISSLTRPENDTVFFHQINHHSFEIDLAGNARLREGWHPSDFSWAEFLWLVPRRVVMVWLVSTAFSDFEFTQPGPLQIILRIGATFLVLAPPPLMQGAGLVLAALLVGHNLRIARRISRH